MRPLHAHDCQILWRLSPELRTELEAAARSERAGIDAILARLVREWRAGRVPPKKKRDAGKVEAHVPLAACVGFYKGDGTSATNELVHGVVGEYVEAEYHRQSSR